MKSGIDLAVTGDLRHADYEATYGGANSFLRRRFSKSLDGVDLAVVGVPLDLATTNRPGARLGPNAVRSASAIMAWERPYGAACDPRKVLAAIDYGDVAFDFGKPAEIADRITREFQTILEAGVATLALGGDHYISYPILRAVAARHGPVALLHFDAHTDTWTDDADRLMDHGTMFRKAADEGLVLPNRSVQVGIRTHNPDPMDFNILDCPWIHANGVEAAVRRIREVVADHPVYLTFDIDCLDPAFAPGTGTPVSGGLSSAQALGILQGLYGLRFVGGDVVEVAPAYDVGQITALAAAHVGYQFLALYCASPAFTPSA